MPDKVYNVGNNIGVWIIGIYGNISSLVIGGTKLLSDSDISPIGILTETEDFKKSKLELLRFDKIVFGGHEIRKGSILESFTNMCTDANIRFDPKEKFDTKIEKYFENVEKNICIGTSIGSSNIVSQFTISKDIDSLSLEKITDKIINDMKNFKIRNNLRDVIVVNLSSTEPPIPIVSHFESIRRFNEIIRENRKDLISASIIYAYASFKNRFPFVNFTPSTGASIPALTKLAEYQDVCYAGNDGKTGETLVKSILSLLFEYRKLKVLAWQSYNILGNLDGKVLTDPKAKLSKEITKDAVVPSILGYKPYTNVGIDYVPSLGDWKVAWDYIQFEGLLGTKMSLQFIWQGCDSILAAPLVIDLIRLVELAHRKGEKGALAHLALFFKQPVGTEIMDLPGQWNLLLEYLKNKI